MIGVSSYLNVEELPRQVKIFECTVNLEISEENLHDSVATDGSIRTDGSISVNNDRKDDSTIP